MDESHLLSSPNKQPLLDKKFKVQESNTNTVLTYNALEVLGSGSFGVVYKVECVDTKEIVAIKKVLQDKRFKNRELQILKELEHPNIIKIKQSFYTPSETDDLYLNVVMEYIKETLSKVIRMGYKSQKAFPIYLVKSYAYQMLKAINYIHTLGICHRDIKPQNILLDPDKQEIKLCDFGSAKKLISGEVNVAYICSRYYRAPELIFGAAEYSFSIDVWSVGCVIAELVLLEPLFQGENSVDQLVEIIKILGTPSKKQIAKMNSSYTHYKFPVVKCYTWKEVFKNKNAPEEFIDLLSKLLVYEPSQRLSPLEAMMHPFFDELREKKNSNDTPLPNNLFYFTNEEYIHDRSNLIKNLVPVWYKSTPTD